MDLMAVSLELAKIRESAFQYLRHRVGDGEAARLVMEAGDDHRAIRALLTPAAPAMCECGHPMREHEEEMSTKQTKCLKGCACLGGKMVKCGKRPPKNAHRWSPCVLPAFHQGFCQHNLWTVEVPGPTFTVPAPAGTVIPSLPPESKTVLMYMGEISRAVDALIAERDAAIARCTGLERANAAMRKELGLTPGQESEVARLTRERDELKFVFDSNRKGVVERLKKAEAVLEAIRAKADRGTSDEVLFWIWSRANEVLTGDVTP